MHVYSQCLGPSEESFGDVSYVFLAANFAWSSFAEELNDTILMKLSTDRHLNYLHLSCLSNQIGRKETRIYFEI